MKFVHVADAHIGSFRDEKLKTLSIDALTESINFTIDSNADFYIIAGDLFNTALPAIEHVKEVVKQLKRLKNENIPVYFIAGSHDYSPSGKTMLDVIEEAGLGINVMRGQIQNKKLRLKFTEDKKTGAKLVGINGLRGMLDKHTYEDLNKEELEREEGFKIFLFHTAIDELKPKYLEQMASYPANLMPKEFNYYAGGHIHITEKKTIQGYENLIYPGPLFPANFHELEKLQTGSFYYYDNGNILKKEVNTKKVLQEEINVKDSNPQEITNQIEQRFAFQDVKNKIVLIRITGNLKVGKPQEIDFANIIKTLQSKGAYYVMKSTTKLQSPDVFNEQEDNQTTEEDIIKEYENQTPNNFKDETKTIIELINTFSQEKNEAEKQTDYEKRIKQDADSTIKQNTKDHEA
ncbi:MAG: exonuclease SbcCD subunit D [Candidatus Woesearchaeota archaeon]